MIISESLQLNISPITSMVPPYAGRRAGSAVEINARSIRRITPSGARDWGFADSHIQRQDSRYAVPGR